MKPVHNWKRAPRMLSVQLAALVVAWGIVPADQQAAMLDWIGIEPARVPAVLGLLVILGRLVDQPKVSE
jgi:hypothetical protein